VHKDIMKTIVEMELTNLDYIRKRERKLVEFLTKLSAEYNMVMSLDNGECGVVDWGDLNGK